MHYVQRINDVRGWQVYLLCKGPRAANAHGVVWIGFNAHEAFIQLYRTMAANS